MITAASVSYTHLDVYKRQTLAQMFFMKSRKKFLFFLGVFDVHFVYTYEVIL